MKTRSFSWQASPKKKYWKQWKSISRKGQWILGVRGGKLRDQMTSLTTGQIVQLKQIFPTSIVWSKIVRLNYFRLHYYYIRVERSYLLGSRLLGHNKKKILQWWKKKEKILCSFLILKIVSAQSWDDPEEVVISADPPRSFTKMMVKVQKALNIMET